MSSLITEDSNLITKEASIILQAALVTNIGSEYAGIVSTIESEWKNGETNLENTILRLVMFEAIHKGSTKKREELATTVLLLASNLPKPGTLRASKDTCTNQECIDRGVISHYTDHCVLKHPELCNRNKYAPYQMRPKGSKSNLCGRSITTSTPATLPSKTSTLEA